MKILVAGGTGFVGRYLIPALLKEWHTITVISRNRDKIYQCFKNSVAATSWDTLNQLNPSHFDVIINLSGENIGDKRWTPQVKKNIKQSRIQTTQQLIHWCHATERPLRFFNASAIGIYGRGVSDKQYAKLLDESTPIHWQQPNDFLSEVGTAWEQAAQPIQNPHIILSWLRFAPVLKRNEGLLKKISPLFKLGFGGPLGTGNQPMSWIYIEDLIHAILFLLAHPNTNGVFNFAAPECTTQKTFAMTLAKVMHVPCWLRTPAILLKMAFGSMATELLLSGQCITPKRLLDAGFTFQYPSLAAALAHDWNDNKS